MKKLLALAASFVAFPAFATPTLDPAPITTYLGGEVTTAVAAVGSAIILLAVTAVGFKWIKGLVFS